MGTQALGLRGTSSAHGGTCPPLGGSWVVWGCIYGRKYHLYYNICSSGNLTRGITFKSGKSGESCRSNKVALDSFARQL